MIDRDKGTRRGDFGLAAFEDLREAKWQNAILSMWPAATTRPTTRHIVGTLTRMPVVSAAPVHNSSKVASGW